MSGGWRPPHADGRIQEGDDRAGRRLNSGRALAKAVGPFRLRRGRREARLGAQPDRHSCRRAVGRWLHPSQLRRGDIGGGGRCTVMYARGQRAAANTRIPGWKTNSLDSEETASPGKPPTHARSCARARAAAARRHRGLRGQRPLRAMSGDAVRAAHGPGFGVEPTGRHNDGCFMAVFRSTPSAAGGVQRRGGRVRPHT